MKNKKVLEEENVPEFQESLDNASPETLAKADRKLRIESLRAFFIERYKHLAQYHDSEDEFKRDLFADNVISVDSAIEAFCDYLYLKLV